MARIERTKTPSQRPSKAELKERKRLLAEAPPGSAAPEWGAKPDLEAGSLKPKTKGVTPG